MQKMKFALMLFLLLAVSPITIVLAATPSYTLVKTIVGPGIPPSGLWTFDIGWIDQAKRMYYFADSSNGRVDIFNTQTDSFVGTINGFSGYKGTKATKGPDGLLTDERNRLWVGDGDSSVKVFGLGTHKLLKTIHTGGKYRADELAYAPTQNLVAVTNGSDVPPFVTFINSTTYKIVGQVKLADANGFEQPFWSSSAKRFFVAVPSTKKLEGGEILVISPSTLKIERTLLLPVDCQPTGLAQASGNDLMVGCDGQATVLDTRSGQVKARIIQVSGTDEVWYNVGDQRYYLAAGNNKSKPVIGVVDAKTLKWITNIPVVIGSHSVTIDATTNQIFVPLSGKGIGVYSER